MLRFNTAFGLLSLRDQTVGLSWSWQCCEVGGKEKATYFIL